MLIGCIVSYKIVPTENISYFSLNSESVTYSKIDLNYLPFGRNVIVLVKLIEFYFPPCLI